MADFSKGDRVSWSTRGNKTTGTVQRKITSDTEAGGRKVSASTDEPQYLVETEDGKQAVHKPDALTKE